MALHSADDRAQGERTVGKFGAYSTAEEVLDGVDLTGKAILLTGCNSGLGFESLRVLTKRGAHVIALARSLPAAEEACAMVAERNRNSVGRGAPDPGGMTPLACNLEDFSSISKAIDSVLSMGKPLDRVMANAGIMSIPTLQRIHGIEKQFFVNHIGHFTLVTGLVDAIRSAAKSGQRPRVIITSSAAHMTTPAGGIRFDNLSGAFGYNPWTFYGQSKLANILFANALARRLPDVDVNSLHPGVIVATGLSRNMSLALRAFWPLARLFGKNIPQGAATQSLLAGRPEVEGITGRYFANCHLKQPKPYARNEDLAEKLWDFSVKFVAEHTGRQIKI